MQARLVSIQIKNSYYSISTELFKEMPRLYRSQPATFSNYNHHKTAKALVGIAPYGAVTFL